MGVIMRITATAEPKAGLGGSRRGAEIRQGEGVPGGNSRSIVEILILLVPLSVLLAFLIGAAFWWSVDSGQFDDLEGPAHRIISDDDSPL
jgi:cbb3-type cytochrome oxidase maturation protein